jgi:hypothetical protein
VLLPEPGTVADDVTEDAIEDKDEDVDTVVDIDVVSDFDDDDMGPAVVVAGFDDVVDEVSDFIVDVVPGPEDVGTAEFELVAGTSDSVFEVVAG